MELFSIDGGLTLWALITFACLFLLLARFVFKPFQRVLKEREDTISASLTEAEKARQAASDLLEDNRKQLEAAREEARHVITEGHRIVATMKQEVKESAKRQADQIIDEARGELDREVQRSLEDLKNTVAGLAVRVSRQVIKEGLDEQRHEELADEFVERLKKRHAKRTT